MLAFNTGLLYALTPYIIVPTNTDKTSPAHVRAAVLAKLDGICRKLNDPKLDTNEKREEESKKIAAAFKFRPDKVFVYSRRVKDTVLEAKIRIPFYYEMKVRDDWHPGGIGSSIEEKAIYLFIIEVDYDVPPDGQFVCGPGSSKRAKDKNKISSLDEAVNAAFDTLDAGDPKRVESAPFPKIPRIAVAIWNIPP